MVGDIAEILMYNTSLSAADQSKAVVYLSGKYGVAQAIVSNPPPVLSITSPTNGATFPVVQHCQRGGQRVRHVREHCEGAGAGQWLAGGSLDQQPLPSPD